MNIYIILTIVLTISISTKDVYSACILATNLEDFEVCLNDNQCANGICHQINLLCGRSSFGTDCNRDDDCESNLACSAEQKCLATIGVECVGGDECASGYCIVANAGEIGVCAASDKK